MGGVEGLHQALAALLNWLETSAFRDSVAVFIASLFAWSALSKLVRPDEAQTAILRFGIARRNIRLWAHALAYFEAVLALGLSAGTVAQLSALQATGLASAVSLLVVFSVMMSRSLLRGESFPCGCFGSRAVFSWFSVLRNLAVGAAATSALTIRGANPDTIFSVLAAVGVAFTMVLVVESRHLPDFRNNIRLGMRP
ncbi:MAG: MauE/DoxX family redox-associated membrane protein [Acidimicrobiales bacterium]